MIEVTYSETSLKDLKKLISTAYYEKIKKVLFEELPASESVKEIRNLKKLEGYTDFFRIRIGDYRAGLQIKNDKVEVLRVLNRKDIYRFFP